jgi:hypothetical protein
MVGTRTGTGTRVSRSRPGQLVSLPALAPRRGGAKKRRSPTASPSASRSGSGSSAATRSGTRSPSSSPPNPKLNLVFKAGRGGRKININGTKYKLRKYKYGMRDSLSGSLTEAGQRRKVKYRVKIFQGQMKKPGMKAGQGLPASSGAVLGRQPPKGFKEYLLKSGALAQLLARRAGLVSPVISNYKSYTQAVKKVNRSQRNTLGLTWEPMSTSSRRATRSGRR